MGSLAYASLNSWQLGYPDRGRDQALEALALAQKLAHPLSQCSALSFVVVVHLLRREGDLAHRRSTELALLAREHLFRHYISMEILLKGIVLSEQGKGEEGENLIQEGRRAVANTGASGGRSLTLGFIAEVYRKSGNVEQGLSLANRGLHETSEGNDRQSEAELYRLKGELTLAQESENQKANGKSQKLEEAEACFQKAIEVARRQQAKSPELRAIMSLARLWQQQGKKDEARQMLAETYGWFTEGFDTVDLKEAKALLAALA